MSVSPRLVGYEGSLSVATSLCLTYTLLIIGARVYIRYRSYGLEDAFVLVATLVSLSFFGIGYACLHDGLGKPYYVVQDSLAGLNSIAIAGAITFILSIYLSKIATLLFMLRIGSIMRSRPLCYACVVLSAVFCLASILVVTVDCPIASGYYWDFTGNITGCPTQLTRWKVMLVLDLISETGLLILPFQLVWSLQMPQGTKMTFVSVFWTQAP
ncbi:hypothetical protein BDV97DRAFT_125842 [Delphinella strobiligena]|nr:hypothetical protein BDV97DRAFT_125842 [Delphinella strobiligena]